MNFPHLRDRERAGVPTVNPDFLVRNGKGRKSYVRRLGIAIQFGQYLTTPAQVEKFWG